MPKVSIIIPVYNHKQYLRARFSSIFSQTFDDYEIILLDDCSTDGSWEWMEANIDDHRITHRIRNTTNSGNTFSQWNKGVALARGKYIWIAESDDHCEHHLLETLVERLESNPQAVIVCSNSYEIDEFDTIKHRCRRNVRWDLPYPKHWDQSYTCPGSEEFKRFFLWENVFKNTSAVLFQREKYLAVGGADVSYRVSGDWKIWGQMLLLGDYVYISEPLNHFRFHQGNVRNYNRILSWVEAWRVSRELSLLGLEKDLCSPEEVELVMETRFRNLTRKVPVSIVARQWFSGHIPFYLFTNYLSVRLKSQLRDFRWKSLIPRISIRIPQRYRFWK